jgi:hypothetical protein
MVEVSENVNLLPLRHCVSRVLLTKMLLGMGLTFTVWVAESLQPLVLVLMSLTLKEVAVSYVNEGLVRVDVDFFLSPKDQFLLVILPGLLIVVLSVNANALPLRHCEALLIVKLTTGMG